MPGTPKRTGPAYIANTATDIFNNSSALIFNQIKRIIVCNKDSSPRTFSLYIGATGGSAGGTEIVKDKSLGIAETWTFPCNIKMLSTDFLSGIASAVNALVITIEREETVV